METKGFIQRILNIPGDIFYVFDLHTGEGLYYNAGWQKILHYSVADLDEMNGHLLATLMHPEDYEQYLRTTRPAYISLGDTETLEHEYRVRDKQGDWHWLKSTDAVFSRNEDGTPKEILVHAADHSELRKLRSSFNIAQQRLSNAEELAAIGNWEIVVGERYSKWSPQMFEFFDLPTSTYSPSFKAFLELVHPEDREIIYAAQKDMIEGKTPVSRIYRTNPGSLPLRYLLPSYYMETSIEGTPALFRGTLMDITDKVEARHQIESLQQKSDAAVRIANIGYWDWIPAEEQIIWSDYMYKIYGRPKDATLSYENIMEQTLPQDRAHHEAMVQGMYVDGAGKPFEIRISTPAGEIKYLLIQQEKITDEAGNAIRFHGTVMDITQSKKTDEAMRASQERYRTLVEQATDAIFITDESGRFITVNPSACKLSQYPEEELLQKTVYDFAASWDLAEKPFRFEELKSGKAVVTERIMRRRDGSELVVEVSAKILSDGRMLVFVRDITERKKVQDEIILERNLSDSVINSLPGIFYLYNQQGQFLRWNKNFELVTGYSAGEIRQMHPLDFFSGKEVELLRSKIAAVFQGKDETVQANFVTKSKNKIPFYFTGSTVMYQDQLCLMGVGLDFTDLVKAEKKIREATGELRKLTAHLQEVREEERKRIGREIHDELGQQLTAIKMDVAWINKKTPEDQEAIKRKLANIDHLLGNSNASVRKILKELRPGLLDDYSLPDALEWQAKQLGASADIKVAFSKKGDNHKIPEQIATCIFRVCQEAVTNILRYAGATEVSISLFINKTAVHFAINDNGQGFEPGKFRKKASFGILGMTERVLSLNGKFSLDSAPGQGTRIQVTMPLNNHSQAKK